MSRVLRRSKTKEKVSAQYGVADPDPADLDIRQTREQAISCSTPCNRWYLERQSEYKEKDLNLQYL